MAYTKRLLCQQPQTTAHPGPELVVAPLPIPSYRN